MNTEIDNPESPGREDLPKTGKNVSLGSPEYQLSTMIEQDKEVVAYLHWALALSRHAKGP